MKEDIQCEEACRNGRLTMCSMACPQSVMQWWYACCIQESALRHSS